jgi:hypothetical protein
MLFPGSLLFATNPHDEYYHKAELLDQFTLGGREARTRSGRTQPRNSDTHKLVGRSNRPGIQTPRGFQTPTLRGCDFLGLSLYIHIYRWQQVVAFEGFARISSGRWVCFVEKLSRSPSDWGFQTRKLRVIGGNENSPRQTLGVWQPIFSRRLCLGTLTGHGRTARADAQGRDSSIPASSRGFDPRGTSVGT